MVGGDAGGTGGGGTGADSVDGSCVGAGETTGFGGVVETELAAASCVVLLSTCDVGAVVFCTVDADAVSAVFEPPALVSVVASPVEVTDVEMVRTELGMSIEEPGSEVLVVSVPVFVWADTVDWGRSCSSVVPEELVASWGASTVPDSVGEAGSLLLRVDVDDWVPLLLSEPALWLEVDDESPSVSAEAIAPLMLPITSPVDRRHVPAIR